MKLDRLRIIAYEIEQTRDYSNNGQLDQRHVIAIIRSSVGGMS